MKDIPAKFQGYIGSYGPQLFDGWCGEPTMWGCKITGHMGEDLFGELRSWAILNDCSLECSYPAWFLVTKKLTRQEAIEKYGDVTNEEFGPRGGWKNVTFGKRTFCSREVME